MKLVKFYRVMGEGYIPLITLKRFVVMSGSVSAKNRRATILRTLSLVSLLSRTSGAKVFGWARTRALSQVVNGVFITPLPFSQKTTSKPRRRNSRGLTLT